MTSDHLSKTRRPASADADITPRQLLKSGVDALASCLQPDGTLHDLVFNTPTQYGSAYYGWCCAVLATQEAGAPSNVEDAPGYRDRAEKILVAALAHTTDLSRIPFASGFRRQSLSISGRLSHRDLTWPPILKTYLALERPVSVNGSIPLQNALAAVDVATTFRTEPPSNWAAVWMSGEWLRMKAGLSTTTERQFDAWIDAFFDDDHQIAFDLGAGMYRERGLPNAYDLFTRAHFTDLLLQGYSGRNRPRLETFLSAGLRRSLIFQLSDGSLASAFRSTAHTWVLGAQIALFTGSRAVGLGTADERHAAGLGAWRAFESLSCWQRDDGILSPVQNRLEPELRVGYEYYTADGHYSPLALAFLASAIVTGFGDDERPSRHELDDREVTAFAEGPPTHRGILHQGRVSAAVLTQPEEIYDAAGLVDVTFGSGRLLQFVSSVRHLSGGPWLNPGLALRSEAGAAEVTAVCGCRHGLITRLRADQQDFLSFQTELLGVREQPGESWLAGQSYRFQAKITAAGLDVRENTPGSAFFRTLLVPYPADVGVGQLTLVTFTEQGVRLELAEEWVEFSVDGEIDRRTNQAFGFENRRGLCGLVRLDLREPGQSLAWSITSSDS